MSNAEKMVLNHLGRIHTSLGETLFVLSMGLDLDNAADKEYCDLINKTAREIDNLLSVFYESASKKLSES